MSKTGAIIYTFVTMPIWYFLLYTMLKAANVDRLCWFLFWVYVPFSFLVSFTLKAWEEKK